MGFGPFGTTGFGIPIADLEDAVRTSLSSSRKIDAETMTYVENDDGGFDPMSDTAQRVLLLIAFEVKEPPILDARYPAIMEARIRKALSPLTSGREPAIKILSISVGTDGRQTGRKRIVFKDLKSSTTQTVEAN